MKKLLSVLGIACLMAACNSSSTSSTTDSTSTTSVDTTSAMGTDTSSMAAATDTTAAAAPAMKDSVMTFKGGKMMVMVAGSWQPLTADVTCTNGVKVTTKGVISKGSKKKTLTEGMMIDKDGQLTDADGKMVDNAGW